MSSEPITGRTSSLEDTFPGEPMDREELAAFFVSRYAIPSGCAVCDKIASGTAPGIRCADHPASGTAPASSPSEASS